MITAFAWPTCRTPTRTRSRATSGVVHDHRARVRQDVQDRAGSVEAVRGIDFEVAAGEIVGLLGPNGAGKTTTQRMLATLLVPTAGEATVAGCDLRRDPIGVRRQLGYVSQTGGTNPAAKVDEELVTQAELYGLSRAVGRERAKRAARRRSTSPTSATA